MFSVIDGEKKADGRKRRKLRQLCDTDDNDDDGENREVLEILVGKENAGKKQQPAKVLATNVGQGERV